MGITGAGRPGEWALPGPGEWALPGDLENGGCHHPRKLS